MWFLLSKTWHGPQKEFLLLSGHAACHSRKTAGFGYVFPILACSTSLLLKHYYNLSLKAEVNIILQGFSESLLPF